MDRKIKGLLAESKSISHFIENGYEVYTPFGDNAYYDLIVVKTGNLYKVSVKCTTSFNDAGSYCVTLKTVSRRKENAVKINRFNSSDFDILSVYVPPQDRIFLFDSSKIKAKCQFNFNTGDCDNMLWKIV